MKPLTTQWGRALDPDAIKPEYPRPNLVRDGWMNLNGAWEFRLDDAPGCERYDRRIRVPFPPEAPLSGVGAVAQPEQTLHYRRRFTLSEDFLRGRALLHFGAVDQECAVEVNGRPVGGHRGGYLPFSLDVSDALRPGENVVEVHAKDRTEGAPYARGKQKRVKKGRLASIFYTPCSGIWKTVWLERVPERYVAGVRFTPVFDAAQVRFLVRTNAPGEVRVRISFEGETVWQGVAAANAPACADLPGFRPWSPDAPNLYDVDIAFGEDRVRSYFGMRSVEVRRDGRGVPRFFLNGKPFFFNGVLDQGYWPDGLLTAPSDAALEYDIRTVKALGFNTLRMHVKVEEERFYHLCDRLGMLVWQDMPNGGGEYNMAFVTYMPNLSDWFARHVRDGHYRWFRRDDPEGRAQYYEELEGMVGLLYNYPSVVLWTPFNEGWGQFDAREAARRIRNLDETRPVNEACGWFDQGGGDVYSIHNYFRRLRTAPKPPRAVALTEFGGYVWPVEGHTASEKAFGYKSVNRSREELTRNYERLWERDVLPNLERGLSAAIYTQVSDIEEELNGLLTYDRAVLKPDHAAVAAMNRRAVEAFDRLTRKNDDVTAEA